MVDSSKLAAASISELLLIDLILISYLITVDFQKIYKFVYTLISVKRKDI
jgi:hypothetical protein